MFIADDVVLFPFKSLLNVFREIHKAAVQEIRQEAASIRAELAGLYQLLEAGALDDQAFDDRERELLDRLDAIEGRDQDDEPDEDEDEESDDDGLDDEDDDDEEDEDEPDLDDEDDDDEDEDEPDDDEP